MLGIVLSAPHQLGLEARPAVDPGPGEVLVRMEVGGICGSDLHYYHDGGFGTVRLKEPMVLGHEVAGRIAALGPGVASGPGGVALREGQRVAVSPSLPCGACRYCQRGLQHHCLDMRFFGSAMRFPHVQGAFREAMVVHASQCHPVAETVSAAEAAMCEPLAVCLHAVRRAGPLVGARVLVTGSGPIGVLAVIAARYAGAADIVATDIAAPALSFAARSGAHRTLNMAETPDALAPYTADKGYFDVLLEASGAEIALTSALAALRPGGVIVQLGLGGDMRFPINTLVAKELELRGTFRFHEEFALAVDLLGKRLVKIDHLVTATMPFREAVEAFELAGDRRRAMKVHLAFV